MVVALLATLKAGGAYVPLDLDYPAERLAFMLADSAPRVLITQTTVRTALGVLPPSLAVLELDAAARPWDASPATNSDPLALGLRPSHLAYVIYTSGSTGAPKGVMVEHRNVINFFAGMDTALGAHAPGTWLGVTSLSFDISVLELCWTLTRGHAVVVAAGQERVAELLSRHGVTHLQCTPSMARMLALDASAAAGLARLQRLLVGGEALPAPLASDLLRMVAGTVTNMYGPTETTIWSAQHPLHAVDGAVPLGRALANQRLYVLDAHRQPVPVGVAGEIHIGGAGVARGYLNRPELTLDRFVQDPFAAEPGARMYRTGDRGRWRPDGTIDFLGRTDHQVKVRGFRIELGEIEARLLQHPGVREAVVLAREDAPGDKRLVAYVVGEPVPPEALRTHLASALPEYAVPAAYVLLQALPLTPNGKLDRRALPAPSDTAFGQHTYEAPEGELESTLASIWSELLGVQRIGRREDFFALGGHSLLAVQLASRLRVRLGCEVPLAELFAQPTLTGFAQRVAAAPATALPAIVPAAREASLPLSFAQQRLWFLAQLDARAAAAYAIPGGVRLKGALDVDALHAVLDRIVARHEVLRTSFASVKGEPVQVTAAPDVGFALTLDDLSEHPEPEAELEHLAAQEAGAPFDLERDPLIRGRLVRLGHDDHALLVTTHHIVSDGWSMGVLVNEFSALYAAYSQGQPDPLPALPLQYADYAVWQRRWITGEVLQRQLDFWRDHLSGAPALLELPTDRPRPPVQDYAGASFGFELDPELSANLKALSQRHGTTLFMTLLAAWAALLARLSGQSDVVIGTPVANRHRAEIEPLIGFFVNTQALRVDLSGSPTVAQLLAQVRATALAAQEHQDIPFEQVVEAVSSTRSLAHSPVFQVMFAWQNTPAGNLELPGLQLQPVGVDAPNVKFDLELSLQDAGDCIAGHVGYACALFDRATVKRHVAHWQILLRALVVDDQAIVARLPLLSDDEQHQLVYGFNDTAASFPAERCIHELFEAQVERTPEATALVFEGTSVSYAELNAQANRLAHHLIALSVRPDSLVAIALPRGIDMVVALLATLKAGGAYVPLDLDYPAERLAFMLADSAPRVLITHSSVRPALSTLPPSLPALDLDAEPRPWESLPVGNIDADAMGVSPAHLAYVIYTSGSTGRPKAVAVEHRQLANLVGWHDRTFGLRAGERSSSVAGTGFDAATWETWPPLCAGATLVLPPAHLSRDAQALLDWWHREPLDVSFLPTPLAEHALTNAQGHPTLRTLLTGGDRLRQLPGRLPGFALINNYGPTETTVVATSGAVQQPGKTPHIGRPIANARIYILDAHGAPVPVGVAGEIHIGGTGVARGYLTRPELTAECFVPDPFAAQPGARMYRTGDLARWRTDGTIEFVGRDDQQVKVRGFRIELGEIEAALRSHPEVREAVVLAREDAAGDKRLVAYVVSSAAPEVLRQHLGSRLPEYMVPAAYVALDSLPLTPNGKLDRRALPAPRRMPSARALTRLRKARSRPSSPTFGANC
jgi:amino acid adenylation domain-containing protein